MQDNNTLSNCVYHRGEKTWCNGWETVAELGWGPIFLGVNSRGGEETERVKWLISEKCLSHHYFAAVGVVLENSGNFQ